MKHPLMIIGFTYFFIISLANFVGISIIYIVGASFFAAFLLGLFIKKIRENKTLLAVFASGFAALFFYALNYNLKVVPAEKIVNQDALITAEICDLPYEQNDRIYYTLALKKVNKEDFSSIKVLLSSPRALDVDLYDEITCFVGFLRLENSPGYFSIPHNRARGIYARAFLYDYHEYKIKKTQNKPFNYYILKTREALVTNVKNYLPKDLSSIVNAVFLGEKHELSRDLRHNLEICGVYHLIATSGVHVMILAQFLLAILKRLKVKKNLSLIISSAGIFVFMALACFSPSVTRAGIMAILQLLAMLFYKNPDRLNSLGAAVLLISLFNPQSGGDIGLWLSFAAVLGIMLIEQPIHNFLKKIFKVKNENFAIEYIFSGISMSLSASIFTLPLAIWFFKNISLVFIFSNILLLFPTALILYFAVFFHILTFFHMPSFLISPVVVFLGWLTKYFIEVIKFCAKIPFSATFADIGFVELTMAGAMILLAFTVFFSNLKKNLKIIFSLSLILFFVGILSFQIFKSNTTLVKVLNCGNGAIIFLSKNRHSAAIFCGEEGICCEVLEDEICLSNSINLDVLEIASFGEKDVVFLKKIIEIYKPKILILHKNNILLENIHENTTYFNENFNINFWGNVNIKTCADGEKLYLYLTINSAKILILSGLSNTKNIPENWVKPDVLVAGALPQNFEQICAKYTILSMSKELTNYALPKLLKNGIKSTSTALCGDFFVEVKNSGKITLRRKL